jgi:hypothetical protein
MSVLRPRARDAPASLHTFDAPKRSCFLPYMLLRMFNASARFFRPSAGASPATLLAVVLGLVSESWWRLAWVHKWRGAGGGKEPTV